MFHDDDVFGSEFDVITKMTLLRMSNADLKIQMEAIKNDQMVFVGDLVRSYDNSKRYMINVIKRIMRKRNQNKV